MNTKTGLAALVVTATLLAAGACGTEQPTARSTGLPGAQSAANTAEDLVAAARQARSAAAAAEAARQARTEHADAERWARRHLPTRSGTSCPVSPDAAERWVRNGISLPECTQVHIQQVRQSADDRRQPV
jgi:hypothetical protein